MCVINSDDVGDLGSGDPMVHGGGGRKNMSNCYIYRMLSLNIFKLLHINFLVTCGCNDGPAVECILRRKSIIVIVIV